MEWKDRGMVDRPSDAMRRILLLERDEEALKP